MGSNSMRILLRRYAIAAIIRRQDGAAARRRDQGFCEVGLPSSFRAPDRKMRDRKMKNGPGLLHLSVWSVSAVETIAEPQGPRRQPAIIDSPAEGRRRWRNAAGIAPRRAPNW